MDALTNEINLIKEQIVSLYNPSKIILFGSQAKGTATIKSDIDLCVVKDTENKRELLADMYLNIESSIPFDLLLYTEAEWNQCVNDTTSFAYLIDKKGTVIYG
ncbi:nucleotidyltransferase domain-containing protein [Clostridium thermosuccinogenes]|uniref:nucleotidyltransferase domain-containing protein n=1 Tax=Clostridium thermosuccinogenes TaxID=84032 RepID=UPI000CCF64A4|nr:nucleotidyltransferase domain-containing protein [Pseudoclostridium thermosuccinogenes]PNT90659.1 nucleotidyltransferase [Pseudoclostridium thermosuccinogenes]